MSAAVPLVARVGNPNTGKTTLFNRLTGQNERVGNYPGVTVERRVGRATRGGFDVLDVPGAYSLSASSAEEQVAIEAVLGIDGNPRPDVVVVVLDATQLVRNLYLAGQLAELGLPLLAVVNFLDETGGRPPDLAALPTGCAFAPRCTRADDFCMQRVPPLEVGGLQHAVACRHPGSLA